jgi:hypothetical protein
MNTFTTAPASLFNPPSLLSWSGTDYGVVDSKQQSDRVSNLLPPVEPTQPSLWSWQFHAEDLAESRSDEVSIGHDCRSAESDDHPLMASPGAEPTHPVANSMGAAPAAGPFQPVLPKQAPATNSPLVADGRALEIPNRQFNPSSPLEAEPSMPDPSNRLIPVEEISSSREATSPLLPTASRSTISTNESRVFIASQPDQPRNLRPSRAAVGPSAASAVNGGSDSVAIRTSRPLQQHSAAAGSSAQIRGSDPGSDPRVNRNPGTGMDPSPPPQPPDAPPPPAGTAQPTPPPPVPEPQQPAIEHWQQPSASTSTSTSMAAALRPDAISASRPLQQRSAASGSSAQIRGSDPRVNRNPGTGMDPSPLPARAVQPTPASSRDTTAGPASPPTPLRSLGRSHAAATDQPPAPSDPQPRQPTNETRERPSTSTPPVAAMRPVALAPAQGTVTGNGESGSRPALNPDPGSNARLRLRSRPAPSPTAEPIAPGLRPLLPSSVFAVTAPEPIAASGPARESRSIPQPPRSPGTAGTPGPTIDVTIGHIEVRLNRPSPRRQPVRATTEASRGPGLSLADYLRRRNQQPGGGAS